MAATFEVHLEWPQHAIVSPIDWPVENPLANQAVYQLLGYLKDAKVHATFYVLGEVALRCPEMIKLLCREEHRIGSHGFWHQHYEHQGDMSDFLARRYLPECVGYRSPFWDTTPRPGMAGGFFFRTLPYQLLKREILQYHTLYLHPHDLYDSEMGPWRRRLFFCNPWQRLERLLHDIDFTRA